MKRQFVGVRSHKNIDNRNKTTGYANEDDL